MLLDIVHHFAFSSVQYIYIYICQPIRQVTKRTRSHFSFKLILNHFQDLQVRSYSEYFLLLLLLRIAGELSLEMS